MLGHHRQEIAKPPRSALPGDYLGEAAIYAVGRIKLAPLYDHITDEAQRALLIEADVCMTYRKHLSNLSLQHTRLCRPRMNVLAEIRNKQQARKKGPESRIRRRLGERKGSEKLKITSDQTSLPKPEPRVRIRRAGMLASIGPFQAQSFRAHTRTHHPRRE